MNFLQHELELFINYCKAIPSTLKRWFRGLPCIVTYGLNQAANDYNIYGNSEQDGTPTPTTPVEVKSVGDTLLPSEYQQVEYLQSSGQQYIDTGFKPTPKTRVDVLGSYLSLGNSIFGVNPLIVLTAASGTAIRFRWNSQYTDKEAVANQFYLMSIDKGVCKLDGTTVTTYSKGSWSTNSTAFIFARHINGGGVEERSFTQVKYCKIWDNDVLVRDMIPCYRKSDSKPGMYDTVTKTFYTNANTSATTDFIVGPDKPPYKIPVIASTVPNYELDFDYDTYDRVEYLESSGEQYIDTGYAVNTENIKLNLVFSLNEIITGDTPKSIFGSSLNDRNWFVCTLHSRQFKTFIGSTTNAINGPNQTANIKYSFTAETNNQQFTRTIDDSTQSVAYTGTTISNSNMYVFNQSGTSGRMVNGKIYSFIMYAESILVRNMIPATRKSDNKPGMYDTITKTFFTNANTSATTDFTTGSVITPPVVTDIYLNQPLRKVGSYIDKINFATGKVYRNVGVVTLDGTTNVFNGITGEGTVNCRALYRPPNRANIQTGTAPYLCDRFTAVNATSSGNTVQYGEVSADLTSNSNFRFGMYELATTVAEANTWLQTHNTTLYYPLATQTEETITLPTLTPFTGTTYFAVDTEVQPFVDETTKGLEIEAFVSQ